jgi:hypothetical protein
MRLLLLLVLVLALEFEFEFEFNLHQIEHEQEHEHDYERGRRETSCHLGWASYFSGPRRRCDATICPPGPAKRDLISE